MATCPIKDENYYKVLEALNFDEEKLYQIHIAYEKAGKEFPTYEELVQRGIIVKEEDPISVISRMYTFSIDRLNKAINKLYDDVKSARESNDTETEQRLRARIADLRADINTIKTARSTIKSKVKETFGDISSMALSPEEHKKLSNVPVSHVYDTAIRALIYVENTLKKPDILSFELSVVARILNTLDKVSSLIDSPIYSSDYIESFGAKEIALLNEISNKVGFFKTKYNHIIKDAVYNELKQVYGDKIPKSILSTFGDINMMSSKFLSIAEYDNPLTTFVWLLGKKAEADATSAIEESFKRIEQLGEKIKNYTQEELKSKLLQDSLDGSYKVPRLVHRYSPKWFQKYGEIKRAIRYAIDTENYKVFKKATTSLLGESYLINPMVLFDSEGNEIQSENANIIRKTLREELSDKSYKAIMEKIRYKRLAYETAKQDFEMYQKFADKEDKKNLTTKAWISNNDPSVVYNKLLNIRSSKESPYEDWQDISLRFLEAVPKKRYKNKKDTGYYDAKFSEIEKDDNLYEILTTLTNMLYELRTYLPRHLQNEVMINSIPMVTRSLIEDMLTQGVIHALPKVWSNFLDSLTINDSDIIVPDREVNPDGTLSTRLRLKGVSFYESFLKNYVSKKVELLMLKNGLVGIDPKNLSQEEYVQYKLKIKEIRTQAYKEANEELVKNMNFDIESMLKIYSAAILTYHSKSKVEDVIINITDMLRESTERVLGPSGKPTLDSKGNPIYKEKGLTNLMNALDYHNRVFFGYSKTNKEMITKKKIYDKDEAELKSLLEKEIDNLDEEYKNDKIDFQYYIRKRLELSDRIASLGRTISVANIIDVVNNYVRLKGLGWNPIAPVFNMGIGIFSNMMEGAREKYFTNSDLLKGYSLRITQRKKVLNIFNKLNSLQTIQSEFFGSKNITNNPLSPFYMTEAAEVNNQAPVVIAYLLATKVKVNGKETNLYELFDDDGNLTVKENDITFAREADRNIKFNLYLIKARLDNIISNIHGNYDPNSSIEANASVLFRSLLVFRKWIINSYWNRLRPERFNWIHNDVEKGRWRSYGAYFKAVFNDVNVLFDKAARKEVLSEVDIQNMRANVAELIFLAAMVALGALIYNMIPDDDDDDKISPSRFAAIFMYNTLGRLTRDVTLYFDPSNFESMLRDPIPAWGLISDIFNVTHNTIKYLGGQPDDMSDYNWQRFEDKLVRQYRAFLPYGFNTLDKINTYTTNKNLYW